MTGLPGIVLVLAHFGHWYIQLIFAAPVLLLGGALLADRYRQKARKGRREKGRKR